MRELKFRVWDKDLCKYLEGCEISGLMAEFDAEGEGREVIIKQICPARYRFEQPTGLKDKNGKEIYEGDIIEEEIDFNSKMTDGTFRYKVCWDDTTLCWSINNIGNESIHDELWETNSSRRIIGNIHENPELIGGEE